MDDFDGKVMEIDTKGYVVIGEGGTEGKIYEEFKFSVSIVRSDYYLSMIFVKLECPRSIFPIPLLTTLLSTIL